MLRNEEDYGPNPDAFNPERFLKDGKLNPDIREPSTMAFGFGRRFELPLNISFPVLSLKSSGNAQENHWRSQCSGWQPRPFYLRSTSQKPSTRMGTQSKLRSSIRLHWFGTFVWSHLLQMLTVHLSSHPLPFKCMIKPRSQEAERLVRTIAEHSHWYESARFSIFASELGFSFMLHLIRFSRSST